MNGEMRERSVAAVVAERERDVWLDNVKILAIVLVVVGHGVGIVRNQSEVAPAVSNFIYIFHIPLFVIVSGWTTRRLTASSANALKMALQLIAPYVIFETFASWLRATTQDHGFRPSLELPTFGLWYLLSLVTWRLWWPWVKGAGRWRLLGGAVATAVAIGYMSRIDHVLSLSRSFVFFPAFLVGAMVAPNLRSFLTQSRTRSMAALILAAAAAFAWLTREWLDRHWLLGSQGYAASGSEQWWAGLWRLIAILAGIVVALAAASLVPQRRSVLSRLGSYTLYAYLLHIVVRQVLVALGVIPSDAGIAGLLVMIAASTIMAIGLMTAPVRALTWPFVEPGRWIRPLFRGLRQQ